MKTTKIDKLTDRQREIGNILVKTIESPHSATWISTIGGDETIQVYIRVEGEGQEISITYAESGEYTEFKTVEELAKALEANEDLDFDTYYVVETENEIDEF